MKLSDRIIALAVASGAAIRTLRVAQGDLTALTTVDKTNLVNAIIEVRALAESAAEGAGAIDDTAGSGDAEVTWSAGKTADQLAAAAATFTANLAALSVSLKNEILGGVGPAFDTLLELSEQLTNDGSLVLQLVADMAKRLRVDAVQVFTAAERLQGQDNLGLDDVEGTDYAAVFVTAATV